MPVDKDDEVLWELRKKLQFFHRNCPADNVVEGLADLEKCTCGLDEQLKDATQLIHAREEAARKDELCNALENCNQGSHGVSKYYVRRRIKELFR